jgi:glycosyltransferase involved in cell wall biosynthesis
MRILSIGIDKKVFQNDSSVRERIVEYGKLAEEMHIIVFTPKSLATNQQIDNVFLYPTNSRNKFFYIFDAIKIGKKILKNNGAWAIGAANPFECGFVAWRLAKKFKNLLYLQIHTDFLNNFFKKESFLNKIRVLTAKFLISRARAIRVVSQRIKNSLVFDFKISDSKITVLPIFVDIEKIKNYPINVDLHKKYPQFDFIILMASRLTKEKNLNLAIDAVKEMGDKKTGLIIVGEGPEKRESLDNIIFESWTDDLVSYYKTADLFLLTSNYEGYAMTLVEAAASGCKIISSDVGIAREILEEENIFKTGDKENLKAKILASRNNMIKPARSLNFLSKEEYLKKYKEFYV